MFGDRCFNPYSHGTTKLGAPNNYTIKGLMSSKKNWKCPQGRDAKGLKAPCPQWERFGTAQLDSLEA